MSLRLCDAVRGYSRWRWYAPSTSRALPAGSTHSRRFPALAHALGPSPGECDAAEHDAVDGRLLVPGEYSYCDSGVRFGSAGSRAYSGLGAALADTARRGKLRRPLPFSAIGGAGAAFRHAADLLRRCAGVGPIGERLKRRGGSKNACRDRSPLTLARCCLVTVGVAGIRKTPLQRSSL